jgi:hypothetical protein
MSAVLDNAAGSGTKPQMKPNQTMIVGRINYVGGFDSGGKRVHEARVAIAAADEYSMPGAVMIQSSYRIGAVGDVVKVLCDVTGFPDRFKDKAGEVKETARNTLRAVE